MAENELRVKGVRKRPVRLLFVEDNAADLELCLREFKKAGLDLRADIVNTPEEFEEHLRANSYDVVLADYCLNGWTGMDALKLLQAQTQDIPFILVTGMLGDETAVDCIKGGAWDYVLKDRLARLPFVVCRALADRYLRDERRRSETTIRESEAMFRTLAETIASAIFIYQGTQCRYVNRGAELITGYSRKELLAMSSWELVHPDSRETVIEKGLARLQGDLSPLQYEMRILAKGGGARWLEVTSGIIDFEGQRAGLITAFDITKHKEAEEQVRYLMASDPLTGLANYCRLVDVFNTELGRSGRTGRSFALVLFDLDGLKHVNDAYGHLTGSRALCRLGTILRVHCRAIDTAARYGGDEFAVILPETRAEAAQHFARRITERLLNDGEQPPLSMSFGIAVHPGDGKTIEELMRTADCALGLMKGRDGGGSSVRAKAAGADPVVQ